LNGLWEILIKRHALLRKINITEVARIMPIGTQMLDIGSAA
jgi:hypothetical protein